MVILCSLRDLKKYQRNSNDINLMIVRSYKETITGIQWFPRLAPSQSLRSFTISNKDRDGFWELFHAKFNQELVSNEKQIGLSLVEDLVQQGHEVNLVCYCEDSSKCHRSDVYKALINRGIECELH